MLLVRTQRVVPSPSRGGVASRTDIWNADEVRRRCENMNKRATHLRVELLSEETVQHRSPRQNCTRFESERKDMAVRRLSPCQAGREARIDVKKTQISVC